MKIGFHVSISGSIDLSIDRALKLDCSTFQIFSRNPRSWTSKPLDKIKVEKFKSKLKSSGIKPVFSHMPYIPNLSSPNKEIYRKSVDSLLEEIDRCNILGIPYLVVHLGSHIGTENKIGLDLLVSALANASDSSSLTILLENSPGSGNHLGSTFEELRDILIGVGGNKLGVCFDTCHAFAAGYDISTKAGLFAVLKLFNTTVGLRKLKLVHLNDSTGALGSGIDHHEDIGFGMIGENGIRCILASPLGNRPLIMETPTETHKGNIDNLKKVLELSSKHGQ